MINFFKKILGISELELRIKRLELSSRNSRIAKKATLEQDKKEVLRVLTGKMTTVQLAKKLNQSRSWTSTILNQLERDGKVVEAGQVGKSVLYAKK